MFLNKKIIKSTNNYLDKIESAKKLIEKADVIVIGAGAGLSSAAGFTYSGERFTKYFSDFIEEYHFRDMYSGGFYPFTTFEEHWAYWSRYIYVNRYMDAPKDTYHKLYELVKDKEYFVITTNVDHQFQKAGFDKQRLFYTQGDFGLFQCSTPCHDATYDNEDMIFDMVKQQKDRRIPIELIPHCPVCGKPMTMNLRSDNSFVEDEGCHQAHERYQTFLTQHKYENIVFLELGVGMNTPVIIKYPFIQLTHTLKNAHYICVNLEDVTYPKEINKKAIGLQHDINDVLHALISKEESIPASAIGSMD